jgi:hypothetical protein
MGGPASDADRHKLFDFLADVRYVLDEIVNARAILFREKLRDPLNAAWPSVRHTIEAVQDQLRNPPDPDDLNRRLGDAGLSEAELSFKIAGFQLAYDRFAVRGTLNLLKKLLKWINSILKSLIAAIPGAESINELKDALENEIEDEDPV